MTISADKSDGTPQQGDHAAHHNELATAVNELVTAVGSGGIPSTETAQVGDALVKKSDQDGDVTWKRLREVPSAGDGRVNDVVTKTGAGDFNYDWRPQGSERVGWGAITKEWFIAGTELPSNALNASDGTVFIVYR